MKKIVGFAFLVAIGFGGCNLKEEANSSSNTSSANPVQIKNEFESNKNSILESIKQHTKKGTYELGRDICIKYRPYTDDEDLKNVCAINYDKLDGGYSKEMELKKADEEAELKKAEEEFKASNPKAWKLHLKHPDWSLDDCEQVAKGLIWIGMSYDMLVASYGRKPDSANPSNYGSGTNWQWCWHNYSPSCFYDKNNDGLIDSYN